MAEVFGSNDIGQQDQAHVCNLKLTEGELGISWHHCSLTSDFIGDFFVASLKASGHDANEARHGISYMVNELLENSVKFRAPSDISVRAALGDGTFLVTVNNLIRPETAERFKALLTELLARDPGELLIERIEQNAADPNSSSSGLGLLTLMNDYGAQLSWAFEDAGDKGLVRLETQAALPL
ncbi:ATP-binding protein [Rhizobium sp. RU36D]|uniref:slr1658 superfamily regulator n=1 Tax=Rhizobium sp. RU36D TaxID=1907415 RepID=UPI0009D86CB7|nr:ATP-binding protein [Rhizobium sp. RU36D]SMC87517.1 hypothetical protein SAMN05880593_108203 [Rhizobium sp. RU36D]